MFCLIQEKKRRREEEKGAGRSHDKAIRDEREKLQIIQ